MHPETAITLATIRQSELRRFAGHHRVAPAPSRFRSRRAGRPTWTQGAR